MGRKWENKWDLKLEPREVPLMCSQEGMMMVNPMTTKWGMQWEQAPLIVVQVGVVRYINLESYLVYNMELRESPMMIFQGGSFLVLNMEAR